MDEREWLALDGFWPLWHAAAGPDGLVPERVKRRVGVFACRRVAHLMTAPEAATLIDTCEGYVERRVGYDDLCAAAVAASARPDGWPGVGEPTPGDLAARAAFWLGPDDSKVGRAVEFATEAVGLVALLAAGGTAAGAFWDHPTFAAGVEGEEERLVGPLRDISGGPAARGHFDPRWRTPAARSLARLAHAGDWAAVPVLADALDDAGCDHAGLLDHLRGPGGHVRGCWAVDLILGFGGAGTLEGVHPEARP